MPAPESFATLSRERPAIRAGHRWGERHVKLASVAAVIFALLAGQAQAEDYPSRPIRVFTTSSAGGLSDIFLRVLNDTLRDRIGQPLIIENKPGGAGNIAARACQDSPPDGYTICIINADTMVYNEFLFKKVPFNPETGLDPDRQSVPPDPGAGGEFLAQCQDGGRTGRGLEGKARHAELSHRIDPLRRLHGQPQARQRRRLGARAVSRRRRGGQRHSRRHHADRHDRARQRRGADQGRQHDCAGAGQQYPHAAVAQGADLGRPRLQGRAVGDLVRAVRARTARRRRSSTSSTPRS